MDGPSGDIKFSNDFNVVYIASLLLSFGCGQRGSQAIQLNEDDCTYQNDGNLHLGKTRLVHYLAILSWVQDHGYSMRQFP